MKENTKKEMALINKLFEFDGYFRAAFTHDDIDLMQQNMENDFDLLCGTSRDLTGRVSRLDRDLADLTLESEKKINHLEDELAAAQGYHKGYAEEMTNQLEQLNENYLDARSAASRAQEENEQLLLRIARLKLTYGEELTDDEKQAVIRAIA